MKMATLASYFCLGPQKHRSLDDVRLNLEILKNCAAVLFLESSVVSTAPSAKNLVSANIIQDAIPLRHSLRNLEGSSCSIQQVSEARHDTLLGNDDTITYLTARVEQIKIDTSHLNLDASDGGNLAQRSSSIPTNMPSYIGAIKNSGFYAGFLEPDEVSVNDITVSHTTSSPTMKMMHIFHLNVPLWLCCGGLTIHFGISSIFDDHEGRPKLNFLVNATSSLSHVLASCDYLVESSLRSNGSTSKWWPLIRKNAYRNTSAIRLHIPIVKNCKSPLYSIEIYRIDGSEKMNKLAFNKFDAAELDSLLVPEATVDAFFCLDPYDYMGNAGIKLVAKCLVIHST